MNIFIVGPMGSGKTTVGKIVANELFLEFFDTDATIESKTGVTIDWIFDIEGEEGFRKRETLVLKELVSSNSIVLATGGGIVIEAENRELLASRGTVFYLHTPLETQISRTAKDKDRPLLKDQDPAKVLADLQESRQVFYQEVSDHIINTENKSGSDVANEIVKLVKNYGPVFASQVNYLITISGIMWGYIILSEVHSMRFWVSLLLIIGGLFLVRPIKIK